MKPRSILAVVAALFMAGTAFATPARLAPGQPIPPAELEALVDGAVRQAIERDHIAGVTVSVVQAGKVILDKGYGFAGPGRPVDPDRTLFRVGSISKTFTWIAVMKEVEAGRMRLDAPINTYLPPSLRVPDGGFARPILVRNLMSHTPGFEDTLAGLFLKQPSQIIPLETQLARHRPERMWEPGVTPSYSNYGAALAGAAVARLESAPFPDVIEREITTPLGMGHTTFREPYPARPDLPTPMAARLAADRSTGYRRSGGAYVPQTYEWVTGIAPAGAASSTAGDMARYMLMILGDGKLGTVSVFGPATAAGFRTDLHPLSSGLDGFDQGFMNFRLPGGFEGHGHGGDTIWFHSIMMTVPELRLGIFASANTDTGATFVQSELPNLIVERFYAPPAGEPSPGAPGVARMRAAYAGDYVANRRPYAGLSRFLFLLADQSRIDISGDGRLLTQGGGGPQSWVPTNEPGVFRQADGPRLIAFQLKGGRAVRWFPTSQAAAYERVGPLYDVNTLLLLGCLATLAAVAALVGVAVRFGRKLAETAAQRRANLAQVTSALMWLGAAVAGAVFAAGASNEADVFYAWPPAPLLAFSIASLGAAILSALSLVMAPAVWLSQDGWRPGRKLRFTMTSLIFCGLGLVLVFWGALEPWRP